MALFGKVAGAWIGSKLAGRNRGARGAILGAGAAALARRGLGPLAGLLALGWGAKKLYDWRRGRRQTGFPSEATPTIPSAVTKSPS